jgi:hypothetical protein
VNYYCCYILGSVRFTFEIGPRVTPRKTATPRKIVRQTEQQQPSTAPIILLEEELDAASPGGGGGFGQTDEEAMLPRASDTSLFEFSAEDDLLGMGDDSIGLEDFLPALVDAANDHDMTTGKLYCCN